MSDSFAFVALIAMLLAAVALIAVPLWIMARADRPWRGAVSLLAAWERSGGLIHLADGAVRFRPGRYYLDGTWVPAGESSKAGDA